MKGPNLMSLFLRDAMFYFILVMSFFLARRRVCVPMWFRCVSGECCWS